MDATLVGKRALVGGASRGIGKACAEALANCGATVVVLARSADVLQQVALGLSTNHGQKHSFINADVNNPTELINSVEKHVEEHGAFHIVVNNTGGPPAGTLEHATTESLVQAYSQHVVTSQLLMQSLVGFMKSENFGRIINIISTSVKQPIEGLGVSNVTRGAMASWAKTLATELGPHGITVNNVLPGATATERLTSIIDRKSTNSNVAKEEVERELLAEIPLGRFAEPEEIAHAVAFLASGHAGYITGTSILVDGGRTRSLS